MACPNHPVIYKDSERLAQKNKTCVRFFAEPPHLSFRAFFLVIPAAERESSKKGKKYRAPLSFRAETLNPVITKSREKRNHHHGFPIEWGMTAPFKRKGKSLPIGKKGKPPLSGREGGSRERKEGEDCVSAASSAAPAVPQPPREASASERKSPIPGGGSSWFVLLTEEKNEQETPLGFPFKWGMTVPSPFKGKGYKRETSKDTQIGKKRNRPYRAGRAAAESGKRARTV